MRFLVYFITLTIIIGCIQHDVFAQQNKTVTVRAAKHPSYIRVVFTGDEEVIRKSSVILQKDNTIKIDLRSPFEVEVLPYGLLKQNTAIEIIKGLKIFYKDNYYFLIYEKIDDIEVSKLATPHRLVVDIYFTKEADTKEKPVIQDTTLYKPADSDKPKIELIVIDAGHGGDDRGLVGSRFVEKDFTNLFTKELISYMSKKGIKTIITRKGDQRLSLRDRISQIKDKRFDVFISIHVSSNEDLVVYNLLRTDNNKGQDNLAKDLCTHLKKTVGNKINIKDSHIQPYFHKNLKKGGVLIELPNPDKFNYDKKTKELLYTSIVDYVLSLEPSVKE